jgi:ComF family protein
MKNYLRFKNFILDLIFPKKCLNCGKERTFCCEDCFSLIEINPFEYCLCEKPQKTVREGHCSRCDKKALNGLYAATDFKQKIVKQLIHNFKYRQQIKELAYPLSALILTHLYFIAKDFPPDSLLIPVPLFARRKKRRGFNQAEEIGKIISEKTNIELSAENLIRVKNTPQQVGLNKEEREKNIQGAFEVADRERVRNKMIFLIDDVYTTGATMEECAKTLKRSGAKQVWGLVAAREIN